MDPSGGGMDLGALLGVPIGPPPPEFKGAPAAPGQVRAWIAQADQIVIANGTPASALDDNGTWIIIQHEDASLNPAEANNWDSNAATGNASVGLMQTTGTTFRAHALPGHGNITDPVDNIIAGERYSVDRYGSIDQVPGVVAVNSGLAYVPY